MFDTQNLFFLVFAGMALVAIIAYIVVSIYRSHMAPLVREAMNAAYDDVEFHKLNLIRERCDGETLFSFEAACTMFRDAEKCLSARRYKRTVELAKQASAAIHCLRGHLVCRNNPMPV